MATRLESAVARVIKKGKTRTYDMGGKDSTIDVATAIADSRDRVRKICTRRLQGKRSACLGGTCSVTSVFRRG